MADSNFARNRDDVPDFADDDPLAELARIVGYDERLVPKPAAAERREPAFNLEDELLHEFERYEAPRPHQPQQPSVSVETFGASTNEPQSMDLAVDQAEFHLSPQYRDQPSSPSQDLDFVFAEEPSCELEPAVERQSLVATEPQDEGDASVVMPDILPAADFVTQVEQETQASPALSLSDELELSLGSVEMPAPDADPRAGRKPIYTPGFRMPLANFHPAKEAPRSAPVRPEQPARLDPSFATETIEAELADVRLDLVDLQPDADVLEHPVVSERVEEPRFEDPASGSASGGEKPLFADVVPVQEVLKSSELDVSAPPVSEAGPIISEPRFDLPFEVKEDPSSLGFSRIPVSPPAPPASVAVEGTQDDEFELALDDLELDLTDMFTDEELSQVTEPEIALPTAPVPATAPAFAPVPPASSTAQRPQFTASWSPIARVVPAPSPAPVAASIPSAPQFAAPAPPPVQQVDTAPEPSSELAFDPALITETEEQIEPAIDLHLPELQVEEQEPVPEYRDDYEYDIDAELASLLQPAEPEQAEVGGPEEQAVPAQPQKATAEYLDLDDFERALEQDFRRSLTTPLPPQPDMQHGSGRFIEGSRRSAAAFALPLAIAGVLVAGGSIAYAIFGGEASLVASNGEPIVIAADTDPVKVLPKDPGGKTVPNQDKAVYDRVAGQVPEAPKQEALISASEEPVDVVQKTLMTDQFPLDGEDMADAADVMAEDDLREDRLVPGVEQASMAAETSQQPVSVMPRRVKTMIVRPDGTLVEQEVIASPQQAAPSALASEPQKVPAASVKSVEVASIPDAPAALPANTSPSPAAAVVPASADASTVAPDMPEPVQSAISAPVPTRRPAQQVANTAASVDSPAPVATAPAAPVAASPPAAAQTQVASLAPGDYVIQIASLPTAADAEKSYKNLSAKFSSVIGGRGVDIREAQVAGKGTFYRVRIPAGSKNDAVALCERYRAAGGSCLVAK